MIRLMLAVSMLIAALCGAATLRAAEGTGAIRGFFVSKETGRRGGEAVVILCDAKTGLPLHAKSRKILTRESYSGLDDLWHTVASMHGVFEFLDVPPGEYRLIAHSWAGWRGMQSTKTPSSITLALGAAENVVVEAEKTTDAMLAAVGDGPLTVNFDPDAEGSFIFISTAPMNVDPILGYLGWGEEFQRNIVAAAHHAEPQSTFIGLPTDRDLYVGVFCYDNLMGFGGTVARAGLGRETTVPIYAAWSDGMCDPPPRLLPLTEHLEKAGVDWLELMQFEEIERLRYASGKLNQEAVQEKLAASMEKRVTVSDLGEVAVKDILAAESYRELRERRRDREERRKQPKRD